MNPALHLLLSIPSSAAFVRPGHHAASARDASDAGVTVVVKRVVWQFVSHDVIPDLAARPGGQRIDLDQAVSRVPLDYADVGARRRLIAPERGDPGVVAFERRGQRLDLANAAAEVRVAFVKALAVNPVLLVNAQPGAALDDVQSVARLQFLFQLIGL